MPAVSDASSLSRPVARLRIVRWTRRARGWLGAPGAALSMRLGRRPTRLVIVPPDLRTVDHSVASDILAGHYSFGGKVIVAPEMSPFAVKDAAPVWTRALYGFAWLRHMKTLDGPDARAAARTMLGDFLAMKQWPREADDPRLVARRLIALVAAAPYLLDGADSVFYAAFLRGLIRHARRLQRPAVAAFEPLARLQAGVALLHLALSTDRSERLARRAIDLVARELDAQIAPDGGHVGRNPDTPVALLFDLIPLRQCFVRRGVDPPPAILNAIDRMLAMARHLRHADGALGCFNGSGGAPRDQLAMLIAYGDAAFAGPTGLRGGYARLVADDAVALVDAAPAGPAAATGRAHAGCLSFEFSADGRRWIVNCGAPRDEGGDLGEAVRATIAHSTATLGNAASAQFLESDDSTYVVGPPGVRADLAEDGRSFAASHDGYRQRFGVSHARSLALDADGGRLVGRDSFAGDLTIDNVNAALRFHIHPTIEPRLADDDSFVQLATRDGAIWRFVAAGIPLEIEDSIFLGDGAPRRTIQIVARIRLDERREVDWTLERVAAGKARGGDDA
jgi:uncharacterized heparinase superfamily protein